MKLVVKEVFIDKYTSKVYEVGQILDFDDKERVDDLHKRGLVDLIAESGEPEKKAPRRKATAKK